MTDPGAEPVPASRSSSQPDSTGPVYVKVADARPRDDSGTCLRAAGMCELGGCCDVCWYRPDHPRFAKH